MRVTIASGRFEALVTGMSAGGLAALLALLDSLPRAFPAAVVVAQHLSEQVTQAPELLVHHGRAAVHARSNAMLREGVIDVCPPQRHILVNAEGTLGSSAKPRLNFVRPSIDWLFETATAVYQERAAGVLLSGANDDGARGTRRIVQAGGLVLVQAPSTCSAPTMPTSAISRGAVHDWLPPAEMGPVLARHIHAVKLRWGSGRRSPKRMNTSSGRLSARRRRARVAPAPNAP